MNTESHWQDTNATPQQTTWTSSTKLFTILLFK